MAVIYYPGFTFGPGGNNTAIQFNNFGDFSGSTLLTWTSAPFSLNIGADASLSVGGPLKDATASAGSAGQFLSSIGSGTLWREITTSDLTGAVFNASGSSHSVGAVPDPGSSAGTTKFLREDSTWAVPSGGGGGGIQSVSITLSAAQLALMNTAANVHTPVLLLSSPGPSSIVLPIGIVGVFHYNSVADVFQHGDPGFVVYPGISNPRNGPLGINVGGQNITQAYSWVNTAFNAVDNQLLSDYTGQDWYVDFAPGNAYISSGDATVDFTMYYILM